MKKGLNILLAILLILLYSCDNLDVGKTNKKSEDYPSSSFGQDHVVNPIINNTSQDNKATNPNYVKKKELLSFITIGEGFTDDQKKIILETFDKYDSLEFGSSYENYKKFFGGDSLTNLTNYLQKRVKYLVPITESDRAKFFPTGLIGGVGYSTIWLDSKPSVKINDTTTVELNNSRHGVVFLGDEFFDREKNMSSVERIVALLREARHADCSFKVSVGTNTSLFKWPNLVSNKADWACTNPRAKCADGSFTCEKLAWGSYAVGNLVLEKIASDCTSCTKEEKDKAQTLAADIVEKSFILNKDETYVGTPDISSYDEKSL